MRNTILTMSVVALLAAPAVAHEPDGPMTANEIVAKAIEEAGGEGWRDARSMHMKGVATLYRGGDYARKTVATRYEMWRVYADESEAAHKANGMFRLDSEVDGRILFQSAFDGEQAYDANGPILDAEESQRDEAGAYGFGVIRFALDDGFVLQRLSDDQIEGHPSHFVKVTDPSGGQTIFAIDMTDYSIRSVAYDTPRGWHQRIYSDFEVKEEPHFRQATRVRFFYDGVKTVDVDWQDWSVNQDFDREIFRIAKREE